MNTPNDLSRSDLESISFEGSDVAEQLPKKMSALLRVAVADAQTLALDPRYKLDMNRWHSEVGGKCYVCLAGAVMACELGVKPTLTRDPDIFGGEHRGALFLIDDMRGGFFYLDAEQSRDETMRAAAKEANRLIQESFLYSLSRAPFYIYLQAADILAEAGL